MLIILYVNKIFNFSLKITLDKMFIYFFFSVSFCKNLKFFGKWKEIVINFQQSYSVINNSLLKVCVLHFK